MAHAICTQCDHETSWPATRGSRLSALKCPRCGGQLRGLTHGHISATQGKHYQHCALCDKKRLNTRQLALPAREPFSRPIVYPTGTILCPRHHLLPASHPYFALIDQPATKTLLESWIAEYETWVNQSIESMSADERAYCLDLPVWWREILDPVHEDANDSELLVVRNTILDVYAAKVKNLHLHERDPTIYVDAEPDSLTAYSSFDNKRK